jgi:hypothetical protein
MQGQTEIPGIFRFCLVLSLVEFSFDVGIWITNSSLKIKAVAD